jgi:hypothetical protein
MKYILTGAILLGFFSYLPAKSVPVVPNFTSGTITSETKTRTEVVETIKQIEYSTGSSYTMTGTNINFNGAPRPGADYRIAIPGNPFQFSETYLTPGISKETWIDRKTIEDSTTNSISVFTQ